MKAFYVVPFDSIGPVGCDSMLQVMEDERVMSIEVDSLNGTKAFAVTEKCDGHYGVYLTKAQLIQLADEIRAKAEELPS